MLLRRREHKPHDSLAVRDERYKQGSMWSLWDIGISRVEGKQAVGSGKAEGTVSQQSSGEGGGGAGFEEGTVLSNHHNSHSNLGL
mmetsp:Transcript_13995/g.21778  ORF Transcript_13995/g.21778 Transcript_13995/m.21778 type:complete len:85 (-) Transcript_13995:301-555(-)